MCGFYTSKECFPKDKFSLPIIELTIDATTSHETLSFMVGLLGYNQIWMVPMDEKLIVFHTPKGIYYYKVMSLGIKNVGVIYQHAP